MKECIYLVWVVLSLLMYSCAEKKTVSEAKRSAPTMQAAGVDEPLTAAYTEGEKVYMTHCFFCHGEQAKGDGPLVASLGSEVKPADFTHPRMAEMPQDSLARAIWEGGSAMGLSDLMPAWKGTLTRNEVDNVVIFIQTVSRQGGLLVGSSEDSHVTDALPERNQHTY